MKLENVIVERPYKKVYRCDEGIAKVFEPSHPKEDVFNEALSRGDRVKYSKGKKCK